MPEPKFTSVALRFAIWAAIRADPSRSARAAARRHRRGRWSCGAKSESGSLTKCGHVYQVVALWASRRIGASCNQFFPIVHLLCSYPANFVLMPEMSRAPVHDN